MIKNNFIKYFLVFLCSLFFATSAWSQKVLISPTAIDESGFGFAKVIGQNEDGYFVLLSNLTMNTENDRVGFKNRKYKLAWFNTSLEKKWSKPIDPPSSDATIDAVTFFNSRVLIITSTYLKQEKKVKYTIKTIDQDGNLSSNSNVAIEFPEVTSDYEKCKIIFSITRQQFAIVMREFTDDTSQTIYAAVIDTALNIITQKSVTIPFSEKKFGIDAYALSVSGDLAVLGYHAEKIKALSSKRKIEFYVYAAGILQPNFKEYLLPSNKIIGTLGIAFDNFNNQLVLAGFYYDKEVHASAGIFYATLDIIKNDEIKINTRVIEGQNGSSLSRERNLSSGSGIMDYPIDRIVVRNDGGALIVAESAYTTEYSYYDSFTQSFTQRLEFHFENVVIISVNKDASVDWSAVVEKDQVSLDDDGVFSSFCSILNSEQLLIVYNDDISKRNKIIPASINNKGELAKGKPIAATEGFILLPRSGKQVSENQLLIPGFRKKDLHLVLYSFE